jgi:Na+/H+ antiporter NhaD/arsenite permease-like protein
LWETSDFSVYLSLVFLFGIAAQFRAMDSYSFLSGLLSLFERKLGALYAVVLITCIFSPVILNDVVVLILTPVLVRYAKRFNVDIAPLLVAEICFTNITSALTPFGNPQDLLIWQVSGISASRFVLGTWLSLAVSGILTAAVLYHFRKIQRGAREFSAPTLPRPPLIYLVTVGATAFILSTVGLSVSITLGVAFVLGFPFTFRSLGRLVREYDYFGLLILCMLIGAVAFVAAIVQPVVVQFVSPAVAGNQPYSGLFVGATSNLISNVPTTQLILVTVRIPQRKAPMLAVEAGLAGNITPVASFANLLALLIVKRSGLPIRKAILLQVGVGLISFVPALL